MGQVITLLVENQAGVLSQVVGLFSQRGYNINTLNVAPSLDSTLSRITLTTDTDQYGIEQVVKQLNKLINVVKVIPYDPTIHVVREMGLLRVRVSEENRAEVLALSEVFRARVVDVSPHTYIFELTGQSEKIDAFVQNMQVYGIREIHRTGELALSRGRAEKKGKTTGKSHSTVLVRETNKDITSKTEVQVKNG